MQLFALFVVGLFAISLVIIPSVEAKDKIYYEQKYDVSKMTNMKEVKNIAIQYCMDPCGLDLNNPIQCGKLYDMNAINLKEVSKYLVKEKAQAREKRRNNEENIKRQQAIIDNANLEAEFNNGKDVQTKSFVEGTTGNVNFVINTENTGLNDDRFVISNDLTSNVNSGIISPGSTWSYTLKFAKSLFDGVGLHTNNIVVTSNNNPDVSKTLTANINVKPVVV